MFNQFEEMILGKLVARLKSFGVNTDVDKLKQAIANSPQIIQQIEAILQASSSEDRLAKIEAIISDAVKGNPV